jgi:peptidoglycan biosynthesis protein MviN/MurJ (putative lipid II flippase)
VLGAIVLRDSAGTGWSSALRANKVTVSAGWATLPGSLAQAVVMQVGHWLAHTRTAGRLTIDDGQSRVDLTALDLLPEVKALAQAHRLVAP